MIAIEPILLKLRLRFLEWMSTRAMSRVERASRLHAAGELPQLHYAFIFRLISVD